VGTDVRSIVPPGWLATSSVVIGLAMTVLMFSHVVLFVFPLWPIAGFLGYRSLRTTNPGVRGLAIAGLFLKAVGAVALVWLMVVYLL
jgi:hypothetical protein